MNLFNRQKSKSISWHKDFLKLLTKEDLNSIFYYEIACKTDPNVLRSTFNKKLYYQFLKIRRS